MDQATYYVWDILVKGIGSVVTLGSVIIAAITLRNQLEKNRLEMEKTRRDNEQTTQQQAEELKWRRTQFLLQLWKDFNSDMTLRPCIRMIDVGDQDPRLGSLFSTETIHLHESLADLRYHFDRYFDFLQSLAFCEAKGTLSLDEIACFGWHYWRLLQSPTLSDYCDKNGYDDVLILAKRIIEHQKNAHVANQSSTCEGTPANHNR
jgi:hypothetical protein